MTKTYISGTCACVNVKLPSGKGLHIAFAPLSNGTSTYTTSDETVQNALEAHYRFGSLFRIAAAQNLPKRKPSAPKPKAVPEVRKVTVSDLASAKEYLADKFGISRTSLRSRVQILAAAKSCGVEFEGLDAREEGR